MVMDALYVYVDDSRQLEYICWQAEQRKAAEERRAAGLPEPVYDEPF
jgi:hypothetical protein